MKMKIKRAMLGGPSKSSPPSTNSNPFPQSMFPDNDPIEITSQSENEEDDIPFVNLNELKNTGKSDISNYFNQFDFTKKASKTTKENKPMKQRKPASTKKKFYGKSFWSNKNRKS